MAWKDRETKTAITYRNNFCHITAKRVNNTVWIEHGISGCPGLTLDQWERFADKIKQLTEDARKTTESV